MERFLSNIEHQLHEEDGFSTVGVALALLISLALIFSAAQVYEINSVSADIQEVADAASLAAENTVGEYCIVASICDAVVLSLSLSSLCCLGLGIAAACTPVTAAASETLLQAAEKIKNTRNTFSEQAKKALEEFKKVLPVIAAAKAAGVIAANSGKRGGASYAGIAILVPWQTDAAEDEDLEETENAFEEASDKKDEIKQLGNEAEDAAHQANLIKAEAWKHDCGSESAYCMYERAKNLAHLDAYDNPYYSSVDTWDFDVALKRAQAYYPKRLAIEAPEYNSVEEHARSALRKHFYQYACSEIAKGYVRRTVDSFEAYFPLLPKNTEEMKATVLYTEARYPRSVSPAGKQVLHAYSGCPKLAQQGQNGTGSLAQMDNNPAFEVCDRCQFSPSSMGNVAAASSVIDNGFEFHYRKVAELARAYQEQHNSFSEESRALKKSVQHLYESLNKAFEEAVSARITIDPPGKYGALAFVVSTDPGRSRFLSRFVQSTGNFSVRAALSGATLVPESTEQGKTTINSVLDGFANAGAGPVLGAAQVALNLWSDLLKGYGNGQVALVAGVENAIDSLPFMSESGLGSWAAEKFQAAIEKVGLQPADLSPQKAALVNTRHIAAADSSSFSARLLEVKERTLSLPGADNLFGSLVVIAEDATLGAINDLDLTIHVASIQIIQGGNEIPIDITLPESIRDNALGLVQDGFAVVKQLAASTTAVRRWE